MAEGGFGKKEHRNVGRVTFTNTDPKIIKMVYNFFINYMKISKDKVKIYVSYNKSIAILDEGEILNFCKNYLNIPENNIKIYSYNRKVKKIRRRQSSQYGICQIRINNVSIRNLIENFLRSILQTIDVPGGGGGPTGSP
ncbi:MAG: hypothetical protein GSR81_06480 [Desulfurococcales archaeon]|nr:hypothetical protein [Desulfurococcales archaeon]